MEIQYREFTHPSACGEGGVFARVWLPDIPPTAVVQIAHGMQEHAGRYDHFARRLAAQGFAVYANDHIGHGYSDLGHVGTFCLKPGGFEYLLQDMHALFDIAVTEYPGLPKVLLGHSMGSIAAAIYPARYDDEDILILMGTPAPNPMLGFGIALAKNCVRRHGPTAVSPLITKMANADIGGSTSTDPMEFCAWLSRDTEEVRKVLEDPLFGKPFSASAYLELFRGLREFGSRGWAKSVKDMPILITAGSDDSCGGRGAGPRHYDAALRSTGHRDVTLRLYEGARHELLHELNYLEVEDMLTDYIAEKLIQVQKG